MSETRPDISLHIEELVLDGLPAAEGSLVARAIETELGRLLISGEMPARLAGGGEIPWLDGGTFDAGAGMSAAALGQQVAQGIYRGLNK